MTTKLLIISAISTLLFLLTFYLFSIGVMQDFDKNTLDYFVNLRSPTLDWLMNFVSSFGDGITAVLTFSVFALALFIKGFRKEFKISFLIWLGPLISWGLKAIIARPRPEEFLIEEYALPSDFSFPSGHVVFYVVFFGLIVLYAKYLPDLSVFGRKLLLGLSLILISLVGVSRIYLGVHWPTDVIGGYLLGFAILGVIIFVYFKSGAVQKG